MTCLTRRRIVALLAAGGVLALQACAEPVLSVQDAWIPLAPPGVEVLAGYMRMSNGTSEALSLTGARSPDFERIELHVTRTVDGYSSMSRESAVRIPAHDEVAFSPGGRHLMMFQPRRALARGDRVEVQLEFDSREPLTVAFELRERGLQL